MRRADRLFQIIQILRLRRLTTAKQLAERLDVSTRTIYRDIQDLSLSGIPIEGEAGVGYLLRHDVSVPPLMFTEQELEAIQVGMRLVQTWGGTELGAAAKQAMIKVEAVLPERLQAYHSLLFAPDFFIANDELNHLDPLRKACRAREYVELDYSDGKGQQTLRLVRPLAIYFWRGAWTLLAWCELRQDFRNFRIDRINQLEHQQRYFGQSQGKELNDFLALMEQQNLLEK